MKTKTLKIGDFVQTIKQYEKQFGKTKQGKVTAVCPDELGELIFVDHDPIDVFWLKKATDPCKTCVLGLDGVCIEAEE